MSGKATGQAHLTDSVDSGLGGAMRRTERLRSRSEEQREKQMLKAVENQEKPRSLIERAEEIIGFLNGKAGKRFPARNPKGLPTANAEVVMHRLKEGYTDDDCKAVIARKVRDWGHDERMSKFLTPETLFRRSNFERYIGECVE